MSNQNKQFAIIGLGRFGLEIAKFLAEKGCEVLVIDKNKEKVEKIEPFVSQALILDATDEEALKEAGIQDFETVIVSVGSNISSSISIALFLKDLGIRRIIAKAIDANHIKALEKIGCDKVILVEQEAAHRLGESLIYPKVSEYFELAPGYSIIEVNTPGKFIGQTLKDLDLRVNYGVSLIAIKRNTPYVKKTGQTEIKKSIIIMPGPKERILERDILSLIGKNEDLEKLEAI